MVEDYSGDRLNIRTEYRNGEPSRRAIHADSRQLMLENIDDNWVEVKSSR